MTEIRMTKHGNLFGLQPEGASFVVRVPERFDDDPIVFAFRVLRREHPAENPMEWSSEEVAA